jgi:1-acyl-sn-glycerol-3-phosphate acyltransferase
MVRAIAAIIVWTVLLFLVGLPALLIGLIHPFRPVMAFATLFWARVMLWVCGVRLRVEGLEHIADGRPRFFVGNHQSALDIPILLAALKGDVRFLAKKSLFYIPIFGWVIARYGYIAVDRRNARAALETINQAMQRFRSNPISFAVFPEGTRSRDGRLGNFRMGTMKICQRWGLPVAPFTIDGAIHVSHRDRTLYVRPGHVRICFGEPIPAEEVAKISAEELHDRIRNVIEAELGRPSRAAVARPRALAIEPSL